MKTIIQQTGASYGCVESVCVDIGCGLGWTHASPVCDAQRRCSCRYVACSAIYVLSLYFYLLHTLFM